LGYGPAAKLVVLAEALRTRGLRLVFVGRGIALEYAARHNRLFDDVITADSPSAVSAALWRSAAGLLSVMDRDFAPAAAEFGMPLLVVDSLLWMREAVPPAWRAAKKLWAQNFVGLHGCPHLHAPGVTVVGPVVAPCPSARQSVDGSLLINLGGCDGAHGERNSTVSYARYVVEQLLASSLGSRFTKRGLLVAGEQCIADLRSHFGSLPFELASLPHADTLAQLDRAALVLTAPGLTMTLESFQRGKPTFFLPPQNYSQWCILRALRDLGLAPAAFHWEDLTPGSRLANRMPESARNPIVRRAVVEGAANPTAGQMLRQCLNRIATIEASDLARQQTTFFASLGTGGVEAVANDLSACLALEGTTQLVPAALL